MDTLTVAKFVQRCVNWISASVILLQRVGVF